MSVLDAVPFLRRDRQEEDTLLESVRSLSAAEALPLSGEPIRNRGLQSAFWGTVLALLAGCVASGIYDAFWQIHWYVHIGSLYWPGWSLKAWFDGGMGFIRSGNWALYRHAAFRDLLLPAAASMGVKSMLAKRKWWTRRVGAVRLLTAPFIVLALAIGMGLAGTWLLDFGGPDLWHHLFALKGTPGYTVPGTRWLGRLAQPVLGILIGLAVHRYWAPVGATLQGHVMDRSVDRWQAMAAKAEITNDEAVRLYNAGLRVLPGWTRWFIPVLRERFADAWRSNSAVKERREHGLLIMAVIVVLAVLAFIGGVGHYWVGTFHHSFPYLFPGS